MEKLGQKSDLDTALVSSVQIKDGERAIGAILVDAGRLKPDEVERVLRVQREKGLRFGETAIQLGLINSADVEFALSCQFDYPYVVRGERAVSDDLVAAHAPFSPKVEALRAVRSQLMLRWFNGDPAHKALAVVSAARSEGRSFIAANLAVVFSQLGKRTLLIDADLRNPVQHRLFNLDNGPGLAEILSGRGGPDSSKRVAALRDLYVLPAGTVPPNPSDLLARPPFARLLNELTTYFDFIIVDTPAAAASTDAQTIAACTGAALVVALKDTSRIAQVRGVADSLAAARAAVVGTVLNDV
jgi:chain length determinant protein tyrosine kinase EpsG